MMFFFKKDKHIIITETVVHYKNVLVKARP